MFIILYEVGGYFEYNEFNTLEEAEQAIKNDREIASNPAKYRCFPMHYQPEIYQLVKTVED